MSKHTPGPWAPMAGMPTNVIGSKMYRVARCDFDGDFDSLEAHANARLIAAAPELLEALRKAIDTTYSDKLQAEWIALISKATGENHGL